MPHRPLHAILFGIPVICRRNTVQNTTVKAVYFNIQAAGHQNGVPWFQLKSVKFSEPVIVFSSNYPLYASMSNRVMVHLEALAPRVEQYSIDEMFLDVRGIDSCIDFEDFDQQLREHVRNGTGLTIGVGMGPTKTLAKSTQWASKEWPQFGGVLA
ncbi:hypothetical protein ABVN72_005138, partial [Escherichia coli]